MLRSSGDHQWSRQACPASFVNQLMRTALLELSLRCRYCGMASTKPASVQFRRFTLTPSAQIDRPFLQHRLQPLIADRFALERVADQIHGLWSDLHEYAQEVAAVEPGDMELLRRVDALRRVLEAVYGQEITFSGEHRARGVVVEGRVDVEEVAGYAAAVRSRTAASGTIRGSAKADRVAEGGEVVGVDIDRIGEP